MSSHYLFTDPACMGHSENFYTGTGDVDDIACIIYLSQQLQQQLTVIICDDESGNRARHFHTFLGSLLTSKYGIQIILEKELMNDAPAGTIVHIHSPTTNHTGEWLERNNSNIAHIFRQGDYNSVNFNSKVSPKTIEVLRTLSDKLTTYSTADTSFTIKRNEDLAHQLKGVALDIYNDYFEFSFRKNFGTAFHTPICVRLYSDVGGDGGVPGNGIKGYKLHFSQFLTNLFHQIWKRHS